MISWYSDIHTLDVTLVGHWIRVIYRVPFCMTHYPRDFRLDPCKLG